jgi:hypothetical protein
MLSLLAYGLFHIMAVNARSPTFIFLLISVQGNAFIAFIV